MNLYEVTYIVETKVKIIAGGQQAALAEARRTLNRFRSGITDDATDVNIKLLQRDVPESMLGD